MHIYSGQLDSKILRSLSHEITAALHERGRHEPSQLVPWG